MASFDSTYDDAMLAAALGAAEIVQRGAWGASSNAPCEIVSCRMPDESLRQLFCKFGPLAEPEPRADRYGISYEALVYDQLLPGWQGDVPRLHGAFLQDGSQTMGLALHYLDGAVPLYQAPQANACLRVAAAWIGRFHRWSETAAVPAFLRRYDTEFYRAWIERAAYFTRSLHERRPWLPQLCQRCQRRLPALLPPSAIVHGEYQASNILVYNGRNVAVDWESAALAAGEIDLASLTWGWDNDLVSLCEQEYLLARWPGGTPDDFALRLTAARVFLRLRWLGEAQEDAASEATRQDLEELLPLAERLRELEP